MYVKYRYFHFFLYRNRKSSFSHLLYLCTELLLLNNYYFVLMLYLWDDFKGRIKIRVRFFLTVGSGSTLAGSRTLILDVLTWHLLKEGLWNNNDPLWYDYCMVYWNINFRYGRKVVICPTNFWLTPYYLLILLQYWPFKLWVDSQ